MITFLKSCMNATSINIAVWKMLMSKYKSHRRVFDHVRASRRPAMCIRSTTGSNQRCHGYTLQKLAKGASSPRPFCDRLFQRLQNSVWELADWQRILWKYTTVIAPRAWPNIVWMDDYKSEGFFNKRSLDKKINVSIFLLSFLSHLNFFTNTPLIQHFRIVPFALRHPIASDSDPVRGLSPSSKSHLRVSCILSAIRVNSHVNFTYPFVPRMILPWHSSQSTPEVHLGCLKNVLGAFLRLSYLAATG